MTSSATKIHVDLDSSDSVDVKNGLTHLDWTPEIRDTEWVFRPPGDCSSVHLAVVRHCCRDCPRSQGLQAGEQVRHQGAVQGDGGEVQGGRGQHLRGRRDQPHVGAGQRGHWQCGQLLQWGRSELPLSAVLKP